MFHDKERDYDAMEAAVAAKLRAEASALRSGAALRQLGGVALLVASVGIAGGAGCLGYSYVVGNQAIARQVADGVTAALAHATINTQVTVKGVVDVSPNSTVRAVVDMPRPSQIQADAKPASGAPVKTDVVKFKSVAFGKGEVITGWRFGDSSQDKPSAQFCQYREPEADGSLRLVAIGEDGQRVGLPNPSPFPSVDLQSAFASCVWTDGQATDARAPVNPAPARPPVITARKG